MGKPIYVECSEKSRMGIETYELESNAEEP
jgi:hypothetical protein